MAQADTVAFNIGKVVSVGDAIKQLSSEMKLLSNMMHEFNQNLSEEIVTDGFTSQMVKQLRNIVDDLQKVSKNAFDTGDAIGNDVAAKLKVMNGIGSNGGAA